MTGARAGRRRFTGRHLQRGWGHGPGTAAALLLLTVGGLAGGARAQEEVPPNPPTPPAPAAPPIFGQGWEDEPAAPRLRATLGAFFPTQATRRGTNRVWAAASLSYDLLPRSGADRALDLAAYFDAGLGYRREQRDFQEFQDTDRQFYGLGLTATIHLARQGAGKPGAYLVAGGGPYLLRRSRARVYEFPSWDEEDGTDEVRYDITSAQEVTFGYRLGFGVTFGKGFFAEATYRDLGRLDTVPYRGTSATLGMRF